MVGLVAALTFVSLLATNCPMTQGQRSHGTDGLHLRRKHHHLLSKLSHYELVKPRRCTQNGEFLSNNLSTVLEENRDRFVELANRSRCHGNSCQRYARAVGDETVVEQPQNVHFSVDAFGVRLVLNLTRDVHLVSPNLLVERHNEDGTTDTSRLKARCFYVGTVASIPGSSVAVSTCDGLSGLIQAGDEEYVIEPLESLGGRSRINVSEGHIHVMYRSNDFRMDSTQLQTNFTIKLHRNVSGETPAKADRQSHRNGRSTQDSDRQYVVETLLVADYSMVTFHGVEDLPIYLLSMLNIVNRVYRHHTMDLDIQFVATRIILLNKTISKKLIKGKRYKQSMTNVFVWASTLTPAGEMHGTAADYVSFVTHMDFGPAGFAPISTICDGYWSSSITRDQGLTSAFVMAHEAGHILGMDHDGDGNSCILQTYARSIMNALVMASYGNYYWSTCSNEYLKAGVGRYQCLDDTRFKDNGRRELHGYPGEWYLPNEQCQYTFGTNSRQCGRPEDYYICTFRCTDPSNPSVCYEYYMPALDGSGCGAVTQWCMKGVCVDKPLAQHGKWSEWSDWSECSYDCDVGVRTRHRKCDNPRPAFGGKECRGKSFQFKICNTQPCTEWVDRRAEQCKDRLASVLLNGRPQKWLPHQNRNESLECRLTCMSKRTLDVLGTPYVVTDGTPCNYDDHHSVCIRGECRRLGCNKRIGSAKSNDQCGICNGDGSGCLFVDEFFADSPRKRYRKVHTLPTGAYNIVLREQTNTSHFIALRYHSDKLYVLNGAGVHRGWPSFVAGGARFQYSQENDHLTSAGPLHDDLDFLVYWTNDTRPINITYSYFLQRAEVAMVGATDLPNGP